MIAAPDRERFDAELRPVVELAYRYAVRLAGNADDAMDLVQDASLNAYRHFDQFESGSNFKAWFLRILTNRFYRTRKTAARMPTVAIDEAPDLFLYDHAKRLGVPMEGDPTAFVFAKADSEMVCDALARLGEDYRIVATLHYLSDMSYEECAQTLEIPIGTVRSRLHRARKGLQVALWQIAEERGYVAGGN